MLKQPFILLIALGTALAGCGPSLDTASGRPGEAVSGRHLSQQTLTQQRILGHFIEGASLDAQGKFAEAILEYQEVLRLDPDNAAAMYALSKDFTELNKHARASEYAREAVARDSMNIAYRDQLAQVYVNAFQRDLAIREYEAILRIDSLQNRSLYSLANLLQTQQPLRALELYEKLMDREGETWELLLQTAEIHSTLGRYDEAVSDFEAMLRLDPSNDALKRQLAETYSKAGRNDDALALLESMHDVRPDDADVSLVLAEMYLERGDTQRALVLFRSIVSRPDLHPEVRVRIGVSLFSQSERDTALGIAAREVFQKARDEQPLDWRPHWYLGAIALNAGQDSVAAASFSRVTELEPRNGDAWWFLGSIYFERGDYENVFTSMYRARQTLPNDFRVYLLLGLAHSQSGEPEDAAIELRKAHRLNPNDVNVLSSLALTLDGLDQFSESDSLYEKALRIDSTNALVLNNYSYSLSERGLQLERALSMATMAVAADPDNSSYLDTIGWIHFKLGNYEEARRYIEEAVATGDASPVVLEHLGDVYEKLGQPDKAREQWQRAYDRDPSKLSLKQKLGIIDQ